LNWKTIAKAALPGLLLCSPTAWAEQWFFSDPLLWNLKLSYDGRWTDTETSPGTYSDSSSERTQQQLTLKKRFHLLDPQLSTFALSAKPLYIQKTEFDDVNGNSTDSDSTAWDYAATTDLLHGARVPFSLSAATNRASGFSDNDLGGETEFKNEHENITINIKNMWLPSYFFYTKDHIDLETRSTLTAAPWQNNYETRRTGFTGRSTKLSLSLESLDYRDLINPVREYTTERGWLNHQLPWGKGSYLQSYINVVEQTGFGAYSRDTVSESLHLKHTETFATDLRHDYNKSVQTSTQTRRQTQLDFSYEPFYNLDTQVGYQWKTNRFDLGDETAEGPSFSVGYTKVLPWKGAKIGIGFNGSRLETDREAQSQLLNVINESQTTDITGLITLNNQFVNTGTIVVTDSTDTITYVLGTHYNINTIANITEIQIIDTVTIPPGTTLLIDYDYTTPPSIQYIDTFRGGYFNFSFRGLRTYYNYTDSEQELLTNAGSNFLNDHRDETTGVSYNIAYKRLQAGLGYIHRQTVIGDYESESYNWNQSLNFRYSSLINFSESLNSGKTETSAADTSSTGGKLKATFQVPWVRIKVGAHVNFWERDDSLGNDDRFLSHGATVDWRYHLINIQAGLTFSDWSGTTRNSEETRFMLNFIRSSR
jgi:hypothetical protein